MKIVISGPAIAYDIETGAEVADPDQLLPLDGLPYSDDLCTNYFDGSPLEAIGLQGGVIRLSFPKPSGALRVVTEYASPRRLRAGELKNLIEDTVAQWSDGIGEGDFIHRDEHHLDVDLFPLGGKVEAQQVDDGIKIKAPKIDPILKAVRDNRVDSVRKLISRGSDVNAKDKNANSPLHIACLWGHLDLAMELLDCEADVASTNNAGATPLAMLGMTNVPEDRYPLVVGAVKKMLARGANVETADAEGRTPLMWAVNRGKQPLIALLLDEGGKINAKDMNGHTVLMYAQSPAIADGLLKRGADPFALNSSGENAGEYVLHNTHFVEFDELVAVIHAAMK